MTATKQNSLVRVEGAAKSYHTKTGNTSVLRSVDFVLLRNRITSLVGVSGSGKSTLISLLAGLLRPDSGRIVFDGTDLAELDESGRTGLRARKIGVVLQNGNLIPFLTARENVELALELGRGPGSKREAGGLLLELGLEHRLEHLPRRISGGEAQRVALAMALANEPDLLLADEITGELDSASAEQVMEVIFDASIKRGLTVFFVTHSTEYAARAHEQLRLVDGAVQPA